MRTGPVVTLQVAKFGASYHGLEALLREPAPEKTMSKSRRMSANSTFSPVFAF